MSSIQSVQNALSGLMAARKRIEVTSHNIANATTKGYSRQQVAQVAAGGGIVPRVFTPSPVEAGGVITIGIERFTDDLLRNRLNVASDASGQADATSKFMSRLEGSMAEPSDSGLSAQLGAFWDAWGALAVSPDSLAARQQVLDQADLVTYTFHRADTEMTDTLSFAGSELSQAAVEVNDLSQQVANLNAAVVAASPGSSERADMLDQRDRIVERLSYLIGAQQTIRADGQTAVYVGGRLLVDNATVSEVSSTSSQMTWLDTGSQVAATGYVGSLHTLVASTIPNFRTKLDAVAAQLVAAVNVLHSAGADTSGTTGRIFFDPASTTAASIKLSSDAANGVSGHPERLAAAAATGGVFDGSNASSIGVLADAAGGVDTTYEGFLAELGVTTKSARSKADAQTLVLSSAQSDLNTISQVNMDDELADLTAAQRAYQASARVVTAIDEMLQDLISHFGRVGS